MKMRFILFMFLLFPFGFATAQLTADFGGGINSKATAAVNIELSYRFKKVNIGTGYIVGLTDDATQPDVFFLKAGKPIQITKTSGIDFGGGAALHSFRELTANKIDPQYSFYQKINKANLLFFANYHSQIIKDGEFFTRAVFTGRYFYVGAGLTYVFKKK